MRGGPLTRVPPVMLLDGGGVTLLEPSGEGEASWRHLLERLHQRGPRTDAGLALLVHNGSSGLDAAMEARLLSA